MYRRRIYLHRVGGAPFISLLVRAYLSPSTIPLFCRAPPGRARHFSKGVQRAACTVTPLSGSNKTSVHARDPDYKPAALRRTLL
ncbi:hypothetical protein HYPSUDRAFT_46625 [Hypholoma sublateritium FD-334 SS-4]|uniref:Uncharacterized protein n=1 Tax=Hypholoma sublateritium (strain FD-334 SS-4) TaxID=945553 RepID=A0A0D2KRN6_HYPSF|nr:hypothetical protein HYPSUDRAFT_46625 [Hypholoma sublateritium FD-334 SS-4]